MSAIVLLGLAAAVAAVAFAVQPMAASPTQPRPRPQGPQATPPTRKTRKGPLAKHTPTKVPWWIVDKKTRELVQKRDPKTKVLLFRTQIIETPDKLRSQAEKVLGRSITGSAYALATMIASEEGSKPPYVKAAVAHAAWNMARAKGLHVEELLAPDGTFGSQHGRYASTRFAPSEEDVNIADGVLSGRLPDVTGGAVQFDSPSAQSALIARGEAGYDPENTASAVEKSRRKEGKEPFYLPEHIISPSDLRFWRKRTA
jgi:hypothetical protein